MVNDRPATSVTRRIFGFSALAGLAGASLVAQTPDAPITSASVPGDPDAPRLEEGTQPEDPPFAEIGPFQSQPAEVKAQPFELTEVRLLPSAFLEAQEANRAYLKALPPDRLLYNFRRNAGLASSAEPLGGWEKPDCELRGHFVGHYLSACGLMYASTGDQEIKARGDEIVSELANCQKRLKGGYLSAFPIDFFARLNNRTPVWAPFYTIHKIMAGLLDMHQYCDNRQALGVLARMAHWADEWSADLPEPHMQMVLDTEYGGMNEVLYNLAAVTKETRFGLAGDRFTKKRFFNPLALRCDELRGLHANTHIPQVIGAARRYELTSDARFAHVATYFWDEISEARTYATGGTGNNEGWLVQPYRLATELSLGTDTNECCCVYNMLKLTRHLYTWSADPRYFDLYERILYNHRLGTIDPKTGMTQYYLAVVPGSWRTFGTPFGTFWCCNGTGVEEYSKLNNSIYFKNGDTLFVNLFIPSELTWREKGIHLRQGTKFPEEDSTRLQIRADKPSRFTLCVRVPGWLESDTAVRINGKQTDFSAKPGSYISISRDWADMDEIEIRLPMKLRYEAMPDRPELRAILYGPVLLSGQLSSEPIPEQLIAGHAGPDFRKSPPPPIPSFAASGKPPEDWIKPAGNALTFSAAGQQSNVSLVPFSSIGERRYSVYWTIS